MKNYKRRNQWTVGVLLFSFFTLAISIFAVRSSEAGGGLVFTVTVMGAIFGLEAAALLPLPENMPLARIATPVYWRTKKRAKQQNKARLASEHQASILHARHELEEDFLSAAEALAENYGYDALSSAIVAHDAMAKLNPRGALK